MSSSASPAPSRRKTLLSLGVLALLTGIVVFIFREHWAEISEALSRLTLGQGLLALAVGLSYPLLEGVSSWLIVRSRLSHFPLRQGIDNAWMGTFGNVVGLGAGSMPFQTWYLHRRGLDVGPGVGLMTLQYVFHKTAVLLYATVLLLAGRPWMAAHSDGVLRYLPGAYAVVAGVIVGLIALCALPVVQRLARWLLHFLPDTGRWAERRESWLKQLDALSAESRHSGRASRKAVPALLPALDGAAVHGAGYRTGLLAGAAPDVADLLCLQRPAQRGGHGLGGDGLPAGVQQLPPRCFVHESADVLPAGQLLRRLCGKRRRLCAGAAAAEPRISL